MVLLSADTSVVSAFDVEEGRCYVHHEPRCIRAMVPMNLPLLPLPSTQHASNATIDECTYSEWWVHLRSALNRYWAVCIQQLSHTISETGKAVNIAALALLVRSGTIMTLQAYS